MTPHNLRILTAAIGLATLLSCATGGVTPQAPSMPAARAALPIEYRIFYDALQDYGDWVLIEPYGFLFRPRVDFATFRPYEQGFWAPSDTYGWVWISAEPFGWATYHYGTWFWDRYQGWVWAPGREWAPAWVTWQVAGPYAGWAPIQPNGASDQGPDRGYLYAPLAQMGATDLKGHLATQDAVAKSGATPEPVEGVVERDGVRVNTGPAFARVERARGGALPRVKIEELRGAAAKPVATSPGEPPRAMLDAAGIESTRRAGESSAAVARSLIDLGARSPSVLRVLKPTWLNAQASVPAAPKGPAGHGRADAAADSTH